MRPIPTKRRCPPLEPTPEFRKLLVIGSILLAAALPAAAQTPSRVPPDTIAGVPVQGIAAILYGEAVLGSERQTNAAATARLNRAAEVAANGYRALASDPALTREALARAILSFYAHPPAAATPAETSARVEEQLLRLMLLQAAQNARLVDQNDRLIQLLEAAAKR
jgi:hypothetical protein